MSDQIQTLRQLQEVDAQLYRLRREQQHKPLVLERTRQLVAEQQAKAQASEAHLKALQLQQKEKELELSAKEANVKKLQMQLFQVKTNKEYTAIQHEIEQTKGDVSLVEEEILKVMGAIETASQDRQAQLAQAAEQQAHFQDEEVRLNQELQAIEEQHDRLQGQRNGILPLIKSPTLAVYERVLASRDGLAMVPLVQESCGGCHMVQPPQVVSEVHLNAKLVTCESCNRILYLETAHELS
ncbi:MAG: hypothetical protein HY596_00140 [Candidatus Omnitrophica bacterium]|nr:hypothetical protein [Candidatus Omnitrophota bacterium]